MLQPKGRLAYIYTYVRGWQRLASSALFFMVALNLAGTVAHASETTTYVLSDDQGNVLALTDNHGNVTARFDYRPYGQQEGGPSNWGPGYSGHVNDADTRLIYMQQRYYDPISGRFLSTDPVKPTAGEINSFNRYSYVANNPISNIDPDGRDLLVIAGGRRTGSWNVFGHVASAIQGYGVASYGNATPLGGSTASYISEQSKYRNQVVTIIRTSPAQDAQATEFVKSEQSSNTATLIDNCAVKTNLILNSAGVSTNDIPFPGGTSRDVASLPNSTTYFIPKNGEVPEELQAILVRFDQPRNTPPAPPPPPPPPTPEERGS